MTAFLVYALIDSIKVALFAVGFSLTYGISGIANFTHGALYVLAGFASWNLMHHLGLPFILAAPLAVILCGLVGFAMYWLLLLRVRGMALAELVVTFAAGVAILEFLTWLGFYGMRYSLPTLTWPGLEIGDAFVDSQRLLVLAVGLALVGALWLFVKHTKIGLAFRGMAQNERTALSVGIESDWIGSLSLALGSALAGVAAVVVLPLGMMEAAIGTKVLILALAVAIIGGLESTWGMVAASFILGFGQHGAANLIGPQWMVIVPLAAIVLVLVIKPSGLLGKYKELEERV